MTLLPRKYRLLGLDALLRVAARYCLRHSLRIQDLNESMKSILLEEAKREIERQGEKVTDSKLSIMTGLHRRDVMRLSDPEANLIAAEKQHTVNLITRILGRWQTDSAYLTQSSEPAVLSLASGDGEFESLVRSVSKELTPAVVLSELERVGAVERTKRGVKLIMQSYVPSSDVSTSFRLLSESSEDLLEAVEENIFDEPEIPNHQLRTAYDRVRTPALPEIRMWLIEQGRAFHKRARDYISQFDQDINPDPAYKGKYAKVSLGSFSKTGKE